MANKTVPTGKSVREFLEGIEDEHKRRDSLELLGLMADVTGEDAVMWGDSIVGFGAYHYQYESGREGDMPLAGFSPRKQSLTLYIMDGFDEYDDLMKKLGKHNTGKSCLYVKRLEDVDQSVLRELVRRSVAHMRESHG
jgi:hypothetical protein